MWHIELLNSLVLTTWETQTIQLVRSFECRVLTINLLSVSQGRSHLTLWEHLETMIDCEVVWLPYRDFALKSDLCALFNARYALVNSTQYGSSRQLFSRPIYSVNICFLFYNLQSYRKKTIWQFGIWECFISMRSFFSLNLIVINGYTSVSEVIYSSKNIVPSSSSSSSSLPPQCL